MKFVKVEIVVGKLVENWSKLDRKLIGKRSKIGRKLVENWLKIVQDLNENCPKTRRKCSKIQRVGIGKSTGVRREVIGSSSGIHRKLLKNNVVQQLVKSSKLVFKSRYAELIRPCIPYNQVASLDMVPDCTPCPPAENSGEFKIQKPDVRKAAETNCFDHVVATDRGSAICFKNIVKCDTVFLGAFTHTPPEGG